MRLAREAPRLGMLDGVLKRRRGSKGNGSAAAGHWRNFVGQSLAESLKLDATLFSLDGETSFDPDTDAAQVVIRLTLSGPQELKKSWDVVRDIAEFYAFENRLLQADFHCPSLPSCDEINSGETIAVLARWLKAVLTLWQREERWGAFLIFRKRQNTEKVSRIAQEMEVFMFDPPAEGVSGFQNLFLGGSGSFSSALKRVESLRSRIMAGTKRRDTDIYMESQRLGIFDENEEIEDSGVPRSYANSTEKSRKHSRFDANLLHHVPLLRLKRRGKLPTVALPPAVACHIAEPPKAGPDSSASGHFKSDAVVSFSVRHRPLKRCSSFGIYPISTNRNTVMRNSLAKDTIVRVQSEVVEPPVFTGKPVGGHKRSGSDTSMYSCGSDMFHFRFTKQTSSSSINYDDIYGNEFEYDDDESYYDEEEMFEDDITRSPRVQSFSSPHVIPECPVLVEGQVAVRTVEHEEIQDTASAVVFDTGIREIYFLPFKATIVFDHFQPSKEDIEDDGSCQPWSPVSIPDTEEHFQEFMFHSMQMTTSLLHQAALKLQQEVCT